jgi:hypothetical protein
MMRMHATDANPVIIDVEAELLGPRKLGETFEIENTVENDSGEWNRSGEDGEEKPDA